MSQQAEIMFGLLVGFEGEAKRLHSGNVNAIAELMEQYQHRLFRYLLRLVSQPNTAEDLFQQTWLRVIEQIHKYDPRRSFEGWLFAVAHNLAIDYLRRRKPESLDEQKYEGVTIADLTASPNPGALEELLSQERADMVIEAMEDLSITSREVLVLRFEEEMKLEEIATVLALPIGTVKTRLHRALKALRHSLSNKMEAG